MAGGGATLQLLATLQRWPGALLRRCGIGRQCTAACSVLPALLQQRVGRCNVATMASNALDLAALLRWPTARWTSQRVAAMSGSVLGLGALLQCPTALQLRPTLHCSVFVFFYPTT